MFEANIDYDVLCSDDGASWYWLVIIASVGIVSHYFGGYGSKEDAEIDARKFVSRGSIEAYAV